MLLLFVASLVVAVVVAVLTVLVAVAVAVVVVVVVVAVVDDDAALSLRLRGPFVVFLRCSGLVNFIFPWDLDLPKILGIIPFWFPGGSGKKKCLHGFAPFL